AYKTPHVQNEVQVERHSRLSVECLEDRCVPTTWGNPWPDAQHLTISFAPDGTQSAGQSSTLFSTLNALQPTAAWQRQILRAFQTWAVEANLNFGFVADGGQAFGTPGRPQSDSRFGDVRIGGFAYTSSFTTANNEELAFAEPFDVTAGTTSGDVRLNSPLWVSGSSVDLYTVMLHEAGHVLGFPHSSDTASVMYEDYLGPRTGLSSGDVAAVQALYGARLPDSYEGSTGNDSLATASKLNLITDSTGVGAVGADADLGKGDRDFYRFTAPSLTGGLQITLQRAGISLLTPRVKVYDSAGNVIASSVSTDPMGGDLTIQL